VDPSDLPDDPKHWPDDPFEVLGVTRGVSDADLRRAYTRLIRRFKPEHTPEQFRRVREAYEACQQITSWTRTSWSMPEDPVDAGGPGRRPSGLLPIGA
jgi:hypothetical protein